MARKGWHVTLSDPGAISGTIEWDSPTISEARDAVANCWGRWGRLPDGDGDVLLSEPEVWFDRIKDEPCEWHDTERDGTPPDYVLVSEGHPYARLVLQRWGAAA